MPQYELENVGPDRYSGFQRARDAKDAVTRAADLKGGEQVHIEETEGFDGWQGILIDGNPSGRIRPHQRMQFRRD